MIVEEEEKDIWKTYLGYYIIKNSKKDIIESQINWLEQRKIRLIGVDYEEVMKIEKQIELRIKKLRELRPKM